MNPDGIATLLGSSPTWGLAEREGLIEEHAQGSLTYFCRSGSTIPETSERNNVLIL